jgi:anti-sigma factor RsiW
MTDHDQTLLGPYVLGVLDAAEVREVEDHLRGCADCRQQLTELEEMKQFLGEVPPEAFLDGPPSDGDLLLQRTLRAARGLDEPAAPAVTASRRTRWLMAAASVAVIAAAALGGGVLIGRETAEYASDQPTAVAGSRQATATEASTTMATTVEPRAGWTWVNVSITGLKAGAECEMVVTDTDGEAHVAGSWVVSEEAARKGSKFSGGVLVPIDQVASVEVKTAQGEHVVTTTL